MLNGMKRKTMKGHRDLIVWHKAMQLARDIYTATKVFPKEELFGPLNGLLAWAERTEGDSDMPGRRADFLGWLRMSARLDRGIGRVASQLYGSSSALLSSEL